MSEKISNVQTLEGEQHVRELSSLAGNPNLSVQAVDNDFGMHIRGDFPSIAHTEGSHTGLQQELRMLAQAGNEKFGILHTVIDGETVVAVTRVAKEPKGRASLVGFVEMGKPLTVGREASGETDPTISKQHFEVSADPANKNIDLHDLQSSNGTFVGIRELHSAKEVGTTPKSGLRMAVRGLKRALKRNQAQETSAEQPESGDLSWSVSSDDLITNYREYKKAQEGREMSSEAKNFWDKGAFKQASSFGEQVQNLKEQPDQRQNILQSKQTAVFSEHAGIKTRRTKFEFSEAEGMQDLDAFIDQALASTEGKKDDISKWLHERAVNFKEKFTFLGEQEFNEACQGVARLWVEYMAQSPKHIINVYKHDASNKSYEVIRQNIVSRAQQMAEGTVVLDRLKIDEADWQDSPDAKLVIVDDWIAGGSTMTRLVNGAVGIANHKNLPGLANKIEAHLLIARKGQTEKTSHDFHAEREYNTRAYFETKISDNNNEITMSGAHSSVDIGFENNLQYMARQMQENGQGRELPLLTYLDRSYSPQVKGMTPEIKQILTQVAELNGVHDHYDLEVKKLQGARQKPMSEEDSKTNSKAIEVAFDARHAAFLERNNLTREYDKWNSENNRDK